MIFNINDRKRMTYPLRKHDLKLKIISEAWSQQRGFSMLFLMRTKHSESLFLLHSSTSLYLLAAQCNHPCQPLAASDEASALS